MFTPSQIRGNGALVAPSKLALSAPQPVLIDTRFNSPFGGTLGFATSCYQQCIAFIAGLFDRRRPSDVSRLIVPILIWIAVKGMLRCRFSANLGQKLLERSKQKLNAAVSIAARVDAGISNVASSFCTIVRNVFRRYLPSALFTMFQVPDFTHFHAQTSARLGSRHAVSCLGETSTGNNGRIAARASAQPKHVSPTRWADKLQNNQPADDQAKKIVNSGICEIFRDGLKIVLRHFASNAGNLFRLGSVFSHRVGPFSFYQNTQTEATI